MRILIMTDSLLLPTGQGRVGREIALGLRDRGHEIGYLGLFHHGDIRPVPPAGIRFWYTNNNHHGQDALDGVVQKFQPDVLLTIGDFWNLWYIADAGICKTRRTFQWCSYIPVDGEPINGGLPPGIVKTVEDIDIPVAYTHYAKNAVMKSCKDEETLNRLEVIYHGVDTNVFKPAQHAERMTMRGRFGLEEKFVFLCVCRNQSRKNIPELLRAWKIFSELEETKGKVILWPHMVFNDPMGWRVDDLLEVLKLRNNSIMYYHQVAHSQSELLLIPDEELAKLYQISDAFVLMSGEGFGLPTFEAMATRLPCVLLDYAASSELGADGLAEFVSPAGTMTWTGGHLTQRPIPDVDRIVQAMLKIYRDANHRNKIADAGYEFATKYTWKRVVDEWHNLFLRHENPHMSEKKLEVVA